MHIFSSKKSAVHVYNLFLILVVFDAFNNLCPVCSNCEVLVEGWNAPELTQYDLHVYKYVGLGKFRVFDVQHGRVVGLGLGFIDVQHAHSTFSEKLKLDIGSWCH